MNVNNFNFWASLFRYAQLYKTVLGIRANDVVHLLTAGDHLEIFFAVLGLWHLGAVPAFGESSLSDEALVDQVDIRFITSVGPFFETVCRIN